MADWIKNELQKNILFSFCSPQNESITNKMSHFGENLADL